jgi:hypothetical protein
MRSLEHFWAQVAPERRVKALTGPVFRGLRALQIPPPRVEFVRGNTGTFLHDAWSVELDPALTDGGTTQDEIRRCIAFLGDTIIHESRHCEQFFRVGRLWRDQHLAKGLATGLDAIAQEITNRLEIPRNIAIQIAASARLYNPIEIAEAREWYGSIYGPRSELHRLRVSAVTGNPGHGGLRFTETSIGDQYYESAFSRYQRGLPEENDAHEIADALMAIYGRQYQNPAKAFRRLAPRKSGVQDY